jgi:hypothetical protein
MSEIDGMVEMEGGRRLRTSLSADPRRDQRSLGQEGHWGPHGFVGPNGRDRRDG